MSDSHKAKSFGTDRTLGPHELQAFMLNSNSQLVLLRGNIVEWHGDAIVNAADSRMLGGGGVDGAIHRAAGPDLLQACREAKEVSPGVRCPVGEARLTDGFRLPARHVIHTVGPFYIDDGASRPSLESAYRSCLEIANQQGFHTIAFPAISCGVFRYPIEKAAETVAESVGNVEEVHFVLFGPNAWKAYLKTAESMFRKIPLDRE